MAQITNQASLTFRYGDQTGTALSNIATAEIEEALTASKVALAESYRAGDRITFVLTAVNNSATALTNLQVTDNLGTYNVGGLSVTPYTYVEPSRIFVNGTSSVITPTVTDDSITFDIGTLPAGGVANIVYNVIVNDTAPLAVDSTITNVATFTGNGVGETVTAQVTLTSEDYADVRITKAMDTMPAADGTNIVYTFTVYNYGNTEATEIVLTDAFDPAPTDITVTVNGVTVDDSEYSYVGGVLTLPVATGSELVLPPASISRDPVTGEVTVVPSSLTIVVTGTLIA